jgi:hypothetical protein
VTQLGVVQFLSQEPARLASAGPKCWYFQRDHWVGSVVQDDGTTQTYKWDGSYFFEKARGLGGVYIENFSVNGQTEDPRTLPGGPWSAGADYGTCRTLVQRRRRKALRRVRVRPAAVRVDDVARVLVPRVAAARHFQSRDSSWLDSSR